MEVFQSTLSVRRATRRVAIIDIGQRISIHALREESDGVIFDLSFGCCYFNPRSP